MEKKKIIIISAKKATTREVTVYGCDFCDHESRVHSRFEKCCLCGRTVCRYWEKACYNWDPHETGDYPDTYCPVCYYLRYGKYDRDFIDIDNEQEEKTQLLLEKIKKISLKTDHI